MSKQNMARPTNWSKNANYGGPKRDPLEDYRGGKPNRAQRRAMERRKRKEGGDD